MFLVRKRAKAEQVRLISFDMTAARHYLVVSEYVPGGEPQVLQRSYNTLRKAIHDARRDAGTTLDVALTGDLTQHDSSVEGRKTRSSSAAPNLAY